MIISTEQTKNGKIKLFADDKYVSTLESAHWYSLGIYDGNDIDGERLRGILLENNQKRALQKAMTFLAYRAHSEKELRAKLRQKDFDAEACDYAIDRLTEMRLLDDEEYARNLAESLIEKKGFSLNRVRMELREKGISSDILENALESLDNDPETRIIELLETKYARDCQTEKGRKKAFNALLRLGYSHSEIRRAFSEAELEDGDFDE